MLDFYTGIASILVFIIFGVLGGALLFILVAYTFSFIYDFLHYHGYIK